MDTICIGDTLKVGKKEIKIHLPILKSGYSWQLNCPDVITVGDNSLHSTNKGYYTGSHPTFDKCKENAINVLRDYISTLQNLKEEDVIDLNVGRPNFTPTE